MTPRHHPRPVSQGWMVTFIDLMALCVGFFVLLHTMNAPMPRDWPRTAQALNDRLGAGSIGSGAPRVDPPRASDPLDDVAGLLRTRLGADAPLTRQAGRVVLDLPAASLFGENNTPTATARDLVGAVASSLASLGLRIDVTGFPPTPEAARRPMQAWRLSFGQAAILGEALRQAGFAGPLAAMASGAGRDERRIEIAVFDAGGDDDAR